MFYLGIDVSKAKLDCLLLDMSSSKRKSKTVPNSTEGVRTLLAWLDKQQAGAAHVIMEPTGVYHEQAALALSDAGLKLSLVNPAQLRNFAQGLGMKNKTDAADSAVLARYGATQNPALWQPPPACVRELRALLARRDAVADDLQREKNRAEKAAATETPALVQQSIDQATAFLGQELDKLQQAIDQHIDRHPDLRDKRALLLSIPGVGGRVSDHLTALLASRDARHFASWFGLTPKEYSSGGSRYLGRISKRGDRYLRMLLTHGALGFARGQRRPGGRPAAGWPATLGAGGAGARQSQQGCLCTGQQARAHLLCNAARWRALYGNGDAHEEKNGAQRVCDAGLNHATCL